MLGMTGTRPSVWYREPGTTFAGWPVVIWFPSCRPCCWPRAAASFSSAMKGQNPPHIHVERGDGYAKFWLEPVELVDAVGMKTRELGRARLLVIQHRIDFREKWREYFGT